MTWDTFLTLRGTNGIYLDHVGTLKVNQYDPLYLLSIKDQVDSKRENMDESNMFKENIIIIISPE
mgnify:CR=1 FL=1